MAVYLRDVVYDELQEYEPTAAVTKGQIELIRDVYCFHMVAAAAGAEATPIKKAKQALADKKTGTGEVIYTGDRLYLDITNQNISPNKGTNTGADDIYCGVAKENAGADDTTVLMEWDGELYGTGL